MPQATTQREHILNTDGPPLDIEGTAALLAWFITGGDASAYLSKIRAIQQSQSGVQDAGR